MNEEPIHLSWTGELSERASPCLQRLTRRLIFVAGICTWHVRNETLGRFCGIVSQCTSITANGLRVFAVKGHGVI